MVMDIFRNVVFSFEEIVYFTSFITLIMIGEKNNFFLNINISKRQILIFFSGK